jgi:hypothetical protein
MRALPVLASLFPVCAVFALCTAAPAAGDAASAVPPHRPASAPAARPVTDAPTVPQRPPDVVTSTLPGISTQRPGDQVVGTRAQRLQSESALAAELASQRALEQAANGPPPPVNVYIGLPCAAGVPCAGDAAASGAAPRPQPQPRLRPAH